ncbi:hypothetical protein Q1695_014475 [Nippostrongylus brasiliensis]|nr:hypothetical protein Q1695_014475 [Nippostrongylus brasiliensis]
MVNCGQTRSGRTTLPTSESSSAESYDTESSILDCAPTTSSQEHLNVQRETSIGIISAACRLPDGVNDEYDLWDLLKTGRTTSRRIPCSRIPTRDALIDGKLYGTPVEGGNFISQDVTQFDHAFFNISSVEADNMDPQQRLLLECVQECIDSAGITDMGNVGVFVGLMEKEYPDLMPGNKSISAMLGSMCSVVSGRINYVYGSQGPSVTVDTACSSSLVAVQLAMDSLKNGDCSVALVAGVNLILSEKGEGARANGKMLSYHGMSLSFDARAAGYGRSDGCVVLLLERVRPGIEYMAEIVHTAVNHDGKSASLTTPNPLAHKALVDSLIRRCGPGKLQYWEAHGTGTRVGDPIEVNALASVLSDVTFGSLKASVGHGEAAAGATALLKVALMLKHGYIPATIHFHVMNDRVNPNSLNLAVVGEDRHLVRCGMTSFGVSGTNAAAIVSESPTVKTDSLPLRRHYFVPISAKSRQSLEEMLSKAQDCATNSSEPLEDVIGGMALFRRHYSERCGLIINQQGQVIYKRYGTCSKEKKVVVLFLSDSTISYDILQIPLIFNFYRSFRQIDTNDEDRLRMSFILFISTLVESIEIHPLKSRDLILALLALSYLPSSMIRSTIDNLLEIKTPSEMTRALEKYGITPSNNGILRRFTYYPVMTGRRSDVLEVRCDSLTHNNLLELISTLYTNGVDLSFECLYRRPVRAVRIPSYSFDRKTHWFAERLSLFDHHLIGTIIDKSEALVKYSNRLHPLRHPQLFESGSSLGVGVFIEITNAALSDQYRSFKSLRITDIQLEPFQISSPSTMETVVKKLEKSFLVTVEVNKIHVFQSHASFMSIDDKIQDVRAPRPREANQRLQATRPFFKKEFKNSKIFFAEDLSYALVDTEFENCPVAAAVEVSKQMNPRATVKDIYLWRHLPLEFEITNMRNGSKTFCLIMSKGQVLMHLCMLPTLGENSLPGIQSLVSKQRLEGTTDIPTTARREENPLGHKIILKESAGNGNLFSLPRLGVNGMDSPRAPHTGAEATPEIENYNTNIHRRKINDLNTNNDCDHLHILHSSARFPVNSNPRDDIQSAELKSLSRTEACKGDPKIMDAVQKTIIAALQDVLPQQITVTGEILNMGFTELGLDSLSLVDFISCLNQKYFPDLDLSATDIFDFPTISELAEHIRKRNPSKKLLIHSICPDAQVLEVDENSCRAYVDVVEAENSSSDPLKSQDMDGVSKSIIAALQDVLPQPIWVTEDTLNMGFTELGLDSLGLVDFISCLNEKYFPGMNLSAADVFDYPTISELDAQVRKRNPRRNILTIDNRIKPSFSPSKRQEADGISRFFEISTPSDATYFEKIKICSDTEACKEDSKTMNNVLSSIIAALQDVLPQPIRVTEDTLNVGFTELGLDSLSLVDFISCLNQKYFPGMNFSAADVFDYPTISELAEHIRKMNTTSSIDINEEQNDPNPSPGKPSKPQSMDSILGLVIAALQDVLPQQITVTAEILNMGFAELGLDSLSLVDFISCLNQKYFPDLDLSAADIFDFPTISELAEHISKRIQGGDDVTINDQTEPIASSTNLSEHQGIRGISASVVAALQDVLPHPILINDDTLNVGFTELGLDSLSLVDFISCLNQKYFPDLDLSAADIFDYPKISELAEHIRTMNPAVSSDTNDERNKSDHSLGKPSKELDVLPQQIIENENTMNTGFTQQQCMDSVLESVMAALQDVLPHPIRVNGDTMNMGFTELGLDSLSLVDFISCLNRKYFPDLDISAADIFDYPTIAGLAEHIRKRNPSRKVSIQDISQDAQASDVDESSLRAYVDVLEDEDAPSDFLLIYRDLGTLIVLNLENAVLKFHSESAVNVKSLFSSLLYFSRQLLSTRLEIHLSVSNRDTLANALARSFFKTLAAEKYPKIKYIYTERLLELDVSCREDSTAIGGNWLITGGLSGIGFTIAQWLLLDCAAENVVLLSRRTPDKALISQLEVWGRKERSVRIISGDVTDFRTLRKEFSAIPFNINGVIYGAGVLRDGLVERQTNDSFSEVFAPKGEGYHVIDRLLDDYDHQVEHFIAMSSFTAVCGNVGQLNYGVSNAYLDYQMHLRRLSGKAGTTIHWGNWLDTGMAMKLRKPLADRGFVGLTNDEALQFLKYAIFFKPSEIVAAKVDWSRVIKHRPDIREDIVVNSSCQRAHLQEYRSTKMDQEEFDPSSPFREHLKLWGKTLPSERCRKTLNTSDSKATDSKRGDNEHSESLETMNDTEELPTTLTCPILGLNIFYDNKDDFRNIDAALGFRRCQSPLPSPHLKPYALQVIGDSLADIKEKLKNTIYRKNPRRPAGKSVMLFAGQGAQYAYMGKQLSMMFPVFREHFERCLRLAEGEKKGLPLMKALENPELHPTQLQSTAYVQPMMFAFGYACSMLWKSFGFQPDYYLGHSVGELVALVVSGVITLEDGVRIVVKRGQILEKIAGRGALLAINRRAAKEILENFDVFLAAENSSRQVVIAGTHDELQKVLRFMNEKIFRGKFVNVKYPFHSPLITEDDMEEFRQVLEGIAFKEAKFPIISNVSGEAIRTFSPEYLVQHIVSPIRFTKCVKTLESLGVTLWLEAGPSGTLTSFVRSTLEPANFMRHELLLTSSDQGNDAKTFLEAALTLERAGIFIDWPAVYNCEKDYNNTINFPLEKTIHVGSESESVLRDHIVNKVNLVPAAYQVYQLLKWINEDSTSDEYFTLTNTKFVSPWNFEGGQEEFKLRRTHANGLVVIVDGQPRCLSRASFHRKPVIPFLDLNAIRDHCKIDCDVKDFYTRMARNGLDYGSRFQVIKSLKRNGKCTYSNLHWAEYGSVWTLFDAALHAVCLSVFHRRPDVYFVPVAIGEIYMNPKADELLPQSTVVCVTKKTAENERFVHADACIFMDGILLFQYRGKLSVVLKAPTEQEVVAPLPVDTDSSMSPRKEEVGASLVTKESFETQENQEELSENSSNTIDEGVYIIGLSGSFCFDAADCSEMWQNLKCGSISKPYKTRVCPLKNHCLMDIDIEAWDPEFFGVSPKEAVYIDVLQRLMMKSVVRCMEDAGLTSIPPETGVFIGVSGSDFNNRVYKESQNDLSGYLGPGTNQSSIAGRIAHWLRIEGPTMVVDTACSSSSAALTLALDALSLSKCKYAIVGGVNIILHDTISTVLKNLGVLSSKGRCMVFDAAADGYIRSEAVGCVLLSRYGTGARFKITAWDMRHNGLASSLHVPNGKSQERLMRAINKSKIEHVECHGTGTSLGDSVEIGAVSRSYGTATVSSLKSILGHAEAASGIVSLLACLNQLKHNYRLPQMHFQCPNPNANFTGLTVNSVGEEFDEDRMAINNFGFSGTNCSIVVQKLPKLKRSQDFCTTYNLIPLSAKNKQSLKKMIEECKSFVRVSDQSITDICLHFQRRRPFYKYRHCILYNYKRQIVWETGEPLISQGNPVPLRTNLRRFAYGTSSEPCELVKKIINGSLPEKVPNPMTPLQYHQFIAYAFTEGQSIDWAIYNPGELHGGIQLPGYVFNEKKYWPFKSSFAVNRTVTTEFKKELYYEKTRLEVPASIQDLQLRAVGIGLPFSVPEVDKRSLSGLESADERFDVVIFYPSSSSIEVALELIGLWQILEMRQNVMVLVACQENGTSYSEWTALSRTLASEVHLPYKFVSFSSVEQLASEISFEDVFECIFYENGRRYVERLRPLVVETTAYQPPPQHLLITGGTGGIGTRIIDFLKPAKSTILTRSAKSKDSLENGRITTFLEWELLAAELPRSGDFDMAVHCAGAVDNGLMSSLDYARFDKVCHPKISGLDLVFRNIEKNRIKKIVVASSAASIFGSSGQANYAFANGLMTSRVEKSSLPTLLVHWGPWKDVGMLNGPHAAKVYEQLSDLGWNCLEPSDALKVLNSKATTNVVVFDGDFRQMVRRQTHLAKFLSELVIEEASDLKPEIFKNYGSKDSKIMQKAGEPTVEDIVSMVSGIEDITEQRDVPLMNLGIDSLMIEEIRLNINEKLGCALKAKEIYDNCTVDKLTELVGRKKPSKKELDDQARNELDMPTKKIEGNNTDIAIISYSGAFPNSASADEFWENILSGNDCITRAPTNDDEFVDAAGILADVDKFDHKFWRMTHEDASVIDPQLRVFLQNAYHALERSGYVRERNSLKIGVFAGAEPNDYGDPSEEPEGSLKRMFKMNMKDFVSTFTAHMLDIRGPGVGVYSACSTALLAITEACNALLLSKLDLAIAGGVSLVLPGETRYEFQEGLVLSKSGTCRPFDQDADGTVRGSAVGCVVLKRLNEALKDNDKIYAVIKSYGLSNDGLNKASFMAPNSSGQEACIREALANLPPGDAARIRYVECHGTGTLVGDEIEIESMKNVYGNRKDLMIGSVKANIGHGFAAAGMASLIKVLKILEERMVPAQVNLRHLREDIHFQVNEKVVAFPPNHLAAVSSFGIGGTNVHLVLDAGPSGTRPTVGPPPAPRLLPVSAASETACIAQCRAIATYLRTCEKPDLDAVAATLQRRRDHFKFRTAVVANTVTQAIEQLESVTSVCSSRKLCNENICFLFTPQGAQYQDMEKESIKFAKAFSDELQRLTRISSELFRTDFMDIMYPQDKSETDLISNARYAQVAIFIISKALLAQLEDWGISSSLLVGHSVGEYAAANYSGVIDDISCLKLLKHRGELVSTTEEARMLAVSGHLPSLPEGIEISAHLSDKMKCVVGEPALIEAFKKTLEVQGVTHRELATKHGFHSSMMNTIKEDFKAALRAVTFHRGTKDIVSTVNGKVISSFDSDYCWDHMRQPVNLKKALDTVLTNKDIKIILEIGPSGIVKQLLAERSTDVQVISTVLGRRQGTSRTSHSQLLNCVADLWALGYNFNFEKMFPYQHFDHNLPTYEFDPISCWRSRNPRTSSRYFVTSWSPTTHLKEHLPHVHLGRVLMITNTADTLYPTIDCDSCKIYSIRPCEVFAFTGRQLSEFSLIIYLPEECPQSLSEPFLLSKKICSEIVTSETRFIVVSSTGAAIHWTTVGAIKQYHLASPRKNSFVDNSAKIPLEKLLSNLLISQEEVLLATSGTLFSMNYGETSEKENDEARMGDTVVIIGGSGAIGSAYAQVLKKNVRNVVVASRNPRDTGIPGISYVTLDVCDKTSVKNALDEVKARYGSLDSIVHVAGVPSVSSLGKTTNEMLSVLNPKVVGVTNVLDYLTETKHTLQSLVLASSMTSVLTIQGTEDYCAANQFLDAVALKGHPYVDRVLSVQWPAWRDAGMSATYKKNSLTEIISKNSISPRKGRQIIRETLGMSGVVTYASIPPLKLNKMLQELQVKGETPKISSIKKTDSLVDKVISVWAEVLGTGVTETSNFFDNGGNSLSALRVVWSLNKLLELNISVDLLFKYPLLGDFVKNLPKTVDIKTMKPFDPTSPAALTYAQENMYLLRQLDPSNNYNIIFALFFRKTTEDFSFKNLIFSIQSLIARQQSFRTTFPLDRSSSSPSQVVLSLTESYQNIVLGGSTSYDALLKEEESYQFNLDEIPLRIRGEQLQDGDFVIVFNQHHILTDGWSVTVLAAELRGIYRAYTTVGEDTVIKLPYSISEYALSQRQTLQFSTELEELRLKLKNKESTVLIQKPTPHLPPSFMKFHLFIPPPILVNVNRLAKENHTTEFVVILSAILLSLRRFKSKGQDNSIVVGYPVSGRSDQVKDLIGYFLNNVVLAVDVGLEDHLQQVVEIVKAETSSLKKYEHVPFHKLVAALNTERQLNEHPLFQIFFNYRHKLDFPNASLPGVQLEIDQISMNRIFDLSITVDELPSGTRVMAEYNESVYRRDLIEEFLGHTMKQFSGKVRPPCSPNLCQEDYPRSAVISRCLSLISPKESRAALSTKDSTICANELYNQVSFMAQSISEIWLKSTGCSLRVDDVICTDLSSNDAVLAILSILKSGAAYAPMDESWPEMRKSHIIENVESKLSIDRTVLNRFDEQPRPKRSIWLNKNTDSDLLYIIHTSGSTGKPKGVAVGQNNVNAFLLGATRQTLLKPNRRVSHSVNVVFDVSVMNILGSLVNSAELFMHEDLRQLPKELEQFDCNFAFITSAMFNSFTNSELEQVAKLEKLFIGGETIHERNLQSMLSSGVDVTQIYGPTECTVWSLTNRCKLLPGEGSLIGLPIPNEACWITSGAKEGELVIEGAKVSRGYLNGAGETRFRSLGKRRCYHTGDIVRQYDEGFRFVGRKDLQMKVRGQLVSAEEVESTILTCSSEISEVKVMIVDEILVAFVVHREPIDRISLTLELKKILPGYMIPSRFVRVLRIPTNASGKVDRELLIEEYKNSAQQVDSGAASLMSLTEMKLASIFKTILKIEDVSSTDNFFNLGGHSLLLFELRNSIIDAFKIELDIHDIFNNLTVQQLATFITDKKRNSAQNTDTSIIVKLRETPGAKFNIYLIHAIGGTIFSYYALLQVFPKVVNLYSIEYQDHFEACTLKELAAFYAAAVAAHTKDVRPFLMGHSLGGTLSREMVAEMRLWGWEIPFVVMFDTWMVQAEQIQLERVRTFAQKVFQSLPDAERRVRNTVRLATMLKEHTPAPSNTKVYLFKSKEVGDEAFRRVVRSDLTEGISRSMTANGLDRISTQPVDTWLIAGNHESCMRAENLCTHKNTILSLFQNWL